jgi:thioredoxin reductase (NADPH)
VNEMLDILIIGAGPAGLAAACAAQDAGLSYAVIDRKGLVQSLVEHPQQIRYFSPSDEMAIGGIPFFVAGGHKPTREDALAYYRAVAATRKLNLATWEEVVKVTRVDNPSMNGHFHVISESRIAHDGERHEYRSRFLLVCTGTFPNPRKLNVPGGDLPKVLSTLDDPTPYFGRDVLVVGGGNSAATAGMTLAEAGANVTVAMRRPPVEFQNHLRPFIVRDLKIMAEEKRLTLITDVSVARIETDRVDLTSSNYDAELPDNLLRINTIELPNDFVFAMIGHQADPILFDHLGITVHADGYPEYDNETAETPIPGIYIAGSLSRANIILESRRRAVEIVQRMVKLLNFIPLD